LNKSAYTLHVLDSVDSNYLFWITNHFRPLFKFIALLGYKLCRGYVSCVTNGDWMKLYSFIHGMLVTLPPYL